MHMHTNRQVGVVSANERCRVLDGHIAEMANAYGLMAHALATIAATAMIVAAFAMGA